jgi:hypothetical protein
MVLSFMVAAKKWYKVKGIGYMEKDSISFAVYPAP